MNWIGIIAPRFKQPKCAYTHSMPKKIFKRWTPDPHTIRHNGSLKFLGTLLHDPNLFHLNRHSVSVAFFVGLFVAFIPTPGQIALAALGALLFRCNLPIAVSLVWISNPLTFPIIFFGAYKLGAQIMQIPPRDFSFQLSWEWLQTEFLTIWQPLVLGCFIASIFFSCMGYIFIQWLWRWHVTRKWNRRKLARQEKA